MNGGAVITNHEQKLKIGHVVGDNVFPKFSILNPEFTYTLPKYQMVAGIYDIFNHIIDWMVHMIGQSIGAYTDATHGMTLLSISMPYYQFICPYGLQKFKRYAINVWDVDTTGKTDEEVAAEGLDRMEAWIKGIGLVMNTRELGVTEDMLKGIANGSFVMKGGYKALTHGEIVEILKNSMK